MDALIPSANTIKRFLGPQTKAISILKPLRPRRDVRTKNRNRNNAICSWHWLPIFSPVEWSFSRPFSEGEQQRETNPAVEIGLCRVGLVFMLCVDGNADIQQGFGYEGPDRYRYVIINFAVNADTSWNHYTRPNISCFHANWQLDVPSGTCWYRRRIFWN